MEEDMDTIRNRKCRARTDSVERTVSMFFPQGKQNSWTSTRWPIKEYFIAEVQQSDLDVIFHHHGDTDMQYLMDIKKEVTQPLRSKISNSISDRRYVAPYAEGARVKKLSIITSNRWESPMHGVKMHWIRQR